jgi:type IV pilus assembly protein PilE
MPRSRGFTLIELMIVVVVISILAGIAIASYGKQVRKSRRSQAMQVLNDLALKEEKFRTNNAEYADIPDLCGNCDQLITATNSPWYSFAATDLTASTWTITATPRAGTDQVNDTCGAFTFALENGVVNKSAEGGSTCL